MRLILLCTVSLAIAGSISWIETGQIKGDSGLSYTPVVIIGNDEIRMYANAKDENGTSGDLYLFSGSWKSVGKPRIVLPASSVTDVANPYIRTTAIVKGTSGAYYGLIHVGSGYPSSNGFRPAWATSPDGVRWAYHGMFYINGIFAPYVLASGANLIVHENITVLNQSSPINNRYVFWEDAYCFTGLVAGGGSNCPRLTMLYSADGSYWFTANDPMTGDPLDVLAVLANEGQIPNTQVLSAIATNGSTTLTGLTSTTGLVTGEYVSGSPLDGSGGASIVSIGKNSVTLLWAAGLSGKYTFTFTGFGGQFPAATQTPYGYHLIAADMWPSNFLAHFFSCDGLKWNVQEINSTVFSWDGAHGTNLVYEPATKMMHALTYGLHWQYPEAGQACP